MAPPLTQLLCPGHCVWARKYRILDNAFTRPFVILGSSRLVKTFSDELTDYAQKVDTNSRYVLPAVVKDIGPSSTC